MSYKISTKESIETITLNESNTALSIVQNIKLILQTRKQSIPLFRDFGLPGNFIDKPLNVARPIVILEITEAIEKFEPRATIIDITFEIDESVPGMLIPILEVEVEDE